MSLLDPTKRSNQAFFHALSRVQTEATQAPYEAKYKSGHTVQLADIWAEPVPYAADAAAVVTGGTVRRWSHGEATLLPVAGSNAQAGFMQTPAGVFLRPWISPQDVPEPTTNEPSLGYTVQLAEQGRPIYATEGRWDVDYYAGLLIFEAGYTPAEMGWSALTLEVYEYAGVKGGVGQGGGAGGAQTFPFTNAQDFVITHNLGRRAVTQILGTNGAEIEGSLTQFSPNELHVVFSEPLSGLIIMS